MNKQRFHKHFAHKGAPIYWIIIAYLIIGYFFPAVGLLALICMIGPVVMAVKRGRWWCGNACPRGNLYDKVFSRFSPHRQIPAFMRSKTFRAFMLVVIFTVFGTQMYYAWGDWNSMGRVFWNIILATTIVGIVLSLTIAPRAWCSFCPMGTLSACVTPKADRLPDTIKTVSVGDECNAKCKVCAKVCPMQLTPYEGKGKETGFFHTDCIKCGTCVMACPLKTIKLSTPLKQHNYG